MASKINLIQRSVKKTDDTLAGLIDAGQERLQKAIRRLEKRIIDLAADLDTDRGRLVSTGVNLKMAQKLHGELETLFDESYGEAARRSIAGFDEIFDRVRSSYNELGVATKFTGVDREVLKTLKDASYSQFEAYGQEAIGRLSQGIYNHVLAGSPMSELTTLIEGIFTGHVDARGRPMTMYANQYAFDTVMNTHNQINVRKAEQANLTHFLYMGDVIKDSRDFCIERAGHVFSREEIESWDEEDWKGKAGPAMVYRGGYNCRHHWVAVDPDWVPEGEIEVQKFEEPSRADEPVFEDRPDSVVSFVEPASLNIEVYDENVVNKYMRSIKTSPSEMVPVFVNREDLSWIVDGNHRAEAYRRLGMKVPVVAADRIETLTSLAVKSPRQVYDEILISRSGAATTTTRAGRKVVAPPEQPVKTDMVPFTKNQEKVLKYAESHPGGPIAMDDFLAKDLAKQYGYTPEQIKSLAAQFEKLEIRVDRKIALGSRSLDGLMQSGMMENQFTLAAKGAKSTSTGALAPYKGQIRDRWETNLSNGIFQKDAAYKKIGANEKFSLKLAKERPIYGYAYDPHAQVVGHTHYGNVSFVLKKESALRCTFTPGNSSLFSRETLPAVLSTSKNTGYMVETFLKNAEIDFREATKAMKPKVRALTIDMMEGRQKLAGFTPIGRAYTEAQIYGGGGVNIARDVEKIVVHGYRTHYGHVEKLGRRWNVPVEFIE